MLVSVSEQLYFISLFVGNRLCHIQILVALFVFFNEWMNENFQVHVQHMCLSSRI